MATQPKSPEARIRQTRGRKLTALKRSLALVRDAVREADDAITAQQVPGDGFLVSAQKYEQARCELILLDALSAGDGDGANGEDPYDAGVSEAMRADVALMVETILSDPQVTGIAPGTALERLAKIAWPDGQAQPAAAP